MEKIKTCDIRVHNIHTQYVLNSFSLLLCVRANKYLKTDDCVQVISGTYILKKKKIVSLIS